MTRRKNKTDLSPDVMSGDISVDTWLNLWYNIATKESDIMQIIPMRDLKNTVEIERLCKEENGPVFVTKNGYGRLVVMDIEYYERTVRKLYEAGVYEEKLYDDFK